MKNMTVSSEYFIILDWFSSRAMFLKNITKSKDLDMDPYGTPENNGFDLDKRLSCVTCTLQLKR